MQDVHNSDWLYVRQLIDVRRMYYDSKTRKTLALEEGNALQSRKYPESILHLLMEDAKIDARCAQQYVVLLYITCSTS